MSEETPCIFCHGKGKMPKEEAAGWAQALAKAGAQKWDAQVKKP